MIRTEKAIKVLYLTPASVENAAAPTGRVLISVLFVTISGQIYEFQQLINFKIATEASVGIEQGISIVNKYLKSEHPFIFALL